MLIQPAAAKERRAAVLPWKWFVMAKIASAHAASPTIRQMDKWQAHESRSGIGGVNQGFLRATLRYFGENFKFHETLKNVPPCGI